MKLYDNAFVTKPEIDILIHHHEVEANRQRDFNEEAVKKAVMSAAYRRMVKARAA
jgi:hypothetical protein